MPHCLWKTEAGFWAMLFGGPHLLLHRPYYEPLIQSLYTWVYIYRGKGGCFFKQLFNLATLRPVTTQNWPSYTNHFSRVNFIPSYASYLGVIPSDISLTDSSFKKHTKHYKLHHLQQQPKLLGLVAALDADHI